MRPGAWRPATAIPGTRRPAAVTSGATTVAVRAATAIATAVAITTRATVTTRAAVTARAAITSTTAAIILSLALHNHLRCRAQPFTKLVRDTTKTNRRPIINSKARMFRVVLGEHALETLFHVRILEACLECLQSNRLADLQEQDLDENT